MKDWSEHAADVIIDAARNNTSAPNTSIVVYLLIHALFAAGMHPRDVTPEIAKAFVATVAANPLWSAAPRETLSHSWSGVWAHCAHRL